MTWFSVGGSRLKSRLRSLLRRQMELNGKHQGIIATNDEIVDLVHMLGYSRNVLERRVVAEE